MGDTVHYANLTNGVLCAPEGSRYCRIPSTWCEQKQWGKVLYGAGPDLLAMLAVGRPVVVHDQSERRRRTRAQWQGLSWLRYATARAWGITPWREFSRGGVDVTHYWERQYDLLGDTDRRWLEYFGGSVNDRTDRISLNPCDCHRQTWEYGDGKQLMKEIH